MCGRYAASADVDRLVEVFEIDEVADEPGTDAPRPHAWNRPRYNIAPSDDVAAVMERPGAPDGAHPVRRLVGMHWGLVPSWSKESTTGFRMINARLETVATKPAFRQAFARRRCLLPADGYYEWYPTQVNGKPAKQPFYIRPAGDDLMVMAGIYEFWRDPSRSQDDPGAWLVSCAIITTGATDDLGLIHDRMPVQVSPENWASWLDPDLTTAEVVHALLHVPQPREMTAYAVSTRVNRIGNDDPSLIQELGVS